MTYNYTFIQWIALFIMYCFVGWIWETGYVSVCEKKWVNRGFMKGPFLPIYGSGAIIVLLVTIPLMKWPLLVYIAGLIAATLLEYVTGVIMEAIFKVRYWDYSKKKFNFQGHICLSSSIAWGFFSLALVYGIHRPFDRAVTFLSPQILTPIVYILSMIIAGDFAVSFKTAIELRDVLIQLEKVRHEAELLKKRMDVLQAFWSDDIEKQKEEMGRRRDELIEKLEWKKDELEVVFSMKKEELEREFHRFDERRNHLLEAGRSRANLTKDRISLLLRHPGAVSVRYKEVFEQLMDNVKGGRK